jgi:hypothetical protein
LSTTEGKHAPDIQAPVDGDAVCPHVVHVLVCADNERSTAWLAILSGRESHGGWPRVATRMVWRGCKEIKISVGPRH